MKNSSVFQLGISIVIAGSINVFFSQFAATGKDATTFITITLIGIAVMIGGIGSQVFGWNKEKAKIPKATGSTGEEKK